MIRKNLVLSGLHATPILLSVLIFIVSCTGQNITNSPKDNTSTPKTASASQPATGTPVGDPLFVETRDTISTHGPRSITRNTLQDRYGNHWLATWEGILRYDGKHFTNVTLKEGLRHFHVFSVLEDRAGNIWFGTIGGGIYRYDGTSFRIFSTADGLVNNTVLCIFEDEIGNIWFGTGGGVSRYDGSTFTNFTTKDGLIYNSVNTMAQDNTGKIWFGTINGVCRYDGQSFTSFTDAKGLPIYNVSSIIKDKSGNIWMGTQEGLCRYDGKSLTYFTKKITSCIFEDKTGNLWLSEGKINAKAPEMSLSRYDGKSFTKLRNDYQIFGITEDRIGNIWFGTVHGVCRYDGKSFTDFAE